MDNISIVVENNDDDSSENNWLGTVGNKEIRVEDNNNNNNNNDNVSTQDNRYNLRISKRDYSTHIGRVKEDKEYTFLGLGCKDYLLLPKHITRIKTQNFRKKFSNT